MKRFAFIVTALLFVTNAAVAGDYKVRLNAGVGIPMSPDELKDSTDPSYAFGGNVTGPLTGGLRFRGQVNFNNLSCAAENCDQDLGITGFQAGLEIGTSGDTKTNFYGFVTAGADRSSYSEGDIDAETDFGMSFGAGLDFKMSDAWGVNVEGRVDGLFPGDEGDKAWWITPVGGVYFKF